MIEQTPLSPIALVLAANEAYAIPLAVTLYSCLANLHSDGSVYLYIIDDSISKQSKTRIQNICDTSPVKVKLEWIESKSDSLLANMKTTDLFPFVTLQRLLIHRHVSLDFDRAIYIDSDVLVRANIRNLWEIDLNNYALLAVEEAKHRRKKNYAQFGISTEEPYFNSGILVFNLKRWRQEPITEKIVEYGITNSEYIDFPDQDTMNATLKDDWKALDLRWNVTSSFLYHKDWADCPRNIALWNQRKILFKEAYIFHFAGGSKPWQIGCEHPAQIEWVSYLIRSGWFNSWEAFWWLSLWGAKYLKWRILGGKIISM